MLLLPACIPCAHRPPPLPAPQPDGWLALYINGKLGKRAGTRPFYAGTHMSAGPFTGEVGMLQVFEATLRSEEVMLATAKSFYALKHG